jgi:hypothetical protein
MGPVYPRSPWSAPQEYMGYRRASIDDRARERTPHCQLGNRTGGRRRRPPPQLGWPLSGLVRPARTSANGTSMAQRRRLEHSGDAPRVACSSRIRRSDRPTLPRLALRCEVENGTSLEVEAPVRPATCGSGRPWPTAVGLRRSPQFRTTDRPVGYGLARPAGSRCGRHLVGLDHSSGSALARPRVSQPCRLVSPGYHRSAGTGDRGDAGTRGHPQCGYCTSPAGRTREVCVGTSSTPVRREDQAHGSPSVLLWIVNFGRGLGAA